MPVATPEVYADMIDRAKAGKFAYPAINVSSSQTLHAALQGFTEAGSDGILQVSTGGAEYFSGPTIKDKIAGSVAFAAFAQEVAKNYPITVALHTDHCPKDKLDGFVRPLLAISEERVKNGQLPLFQSHMWDGSAVPMEENLSIAAELLERCAAANIILEIEVGVVGGEEDGVMAEINEKLYTTVEDGLRTAEVLGLGEKGRYITALTFGNVHGVYKPGAVKLRPAVLKEIQDAVGAKYGKESPFDLVFHGGSGSTAQEISDAVDFGVIKMNIDTDTQYAFTRPVVEHMFRNYDGVLKIDGEVGNKKMYDPRAWARRPRPAWPSASSRPVSSCVPQGPRRASDARLNHEGGPILRGSGHLRVGAVSEVAARVGYGPTSGPRSSNESSSPWVRAVKRRSSNPTTVRSATPPVAMTVTTNQPQLAGGVAVVVSSGTGNVDSVAVSSGAVVGSGLGSGAAVVASGVGVPSAEACLISTRAVREVPRSVLEPL